MDYVSINLKRGEDLRILIEDMNEDLESAVGSEPELTSGNETKYKVMFSRYLERVDTFEENKKKIYTLIIGQCTPGLTTAIKSHSGYTAQSKNRNPVWLMKATKKLSVGIEEKANYMKTAHNCAKRMYTLYQKPTESLDDYFDRFKELWNTAEAAGGKNILVPDLPANCPIYGTMD